jgi:signal transduction histidine kinase
MEITIYSILYLFSAIFCFTLAYISYIRRKVSGAFELMMLLISVGLWVFFLFFEVSAVEETTKIFWSKMSYLGVTTAPVMFLFFIVKFCGFDVFKTHLQRLFLFIIPAITFFLALTNEKHNLIWTGYSEISDSSNLMVYNHGFWFWIGYVVFSYMLLAVSTFYMMVFLVSNKNKFRSQAILVFIATIFPWIGSIFYILDLNPVPGLDLTSVLMLVSLVLFTIGFLNKYLLNLVPLARQTILETITDGILALDKYDRILDINSYALDILDISGKRILGHELSQVASRNLKLLDAVLSDTTPVLLSTLVNGKSFSFKIIKEPVKSDPENRIVIIRDITELVENQKRILADEYEARKMHRLLRIMTDNFNLMIWAKDMEKKYIFSNKALNDMILKTIDPEESYGVSTSYFYERRILMNPEIKNDLQFMLKEEKIDDIILKNKKPVTYEQEVSIDGEKKLLYVSKLPMFDEDGEIIGVVGSARDITFQKEAEKNLIEAKLKAEENDRQKSEFLSNMSHEIRTPMNSILGFISLLDDETLTEAEKKNYLAIARRSGELLLNTINDIIDVSKIESGKMKVNFVEFDINDLIDYLNSFFSQEAEIKNLKFISPGIIDYSRSLILTDKEKLYSITTNLINNAIKYTREGFVEYRVDIKDDWLFLDVIDSGIGISEDRMKFIFDRFSLSSHSLEGKYKSTGLGLSITKAYCEMLGGEISCESKIDIGSTFFVKIPVKTIENNITI